MKRTNSMRVLDTFKACLVGLMAGVVGWCVYQPGAAQVLAHGIGAHASVVIAGPLAAHDAPALDQLVAFAWAATSFLSVVVFFAFFLTFSVAVYLILEWAGRSKKIKVQK